MAKLEDLIAHIPDETLRNAIASEVKELKKTKHYGLVFEEHIPEVTAVHGLTAYHGALIQRKADLGSSDLFRVLSIDGQGKVLIEPVQGGGPLTVSADELLVVKRFGDPIYPTLTPRGSIRRGSDVQPSHAVINGENFHALQLLLFLYEAKVDCIYIDPPYNTRDNDWKYNNRYVDSNDLWKHSKWLAFMKRRLTLAKRLLNPSKSALIVTIDEKEYLRLGLLLEELFRGCNIQMVSTFVNPAYVARGDSFGRSDEYIFFVMIGSASPQRIRLSREWVSARGRTHTGNLRWDLLRRSGAESAREDRENGFYPIYIDPDGPKIAKVGEPLPRGVSVAEPLAGCVPVLPIRQNGSEGRWQWEAATTRRRHLQGRVRVTGSETDGYVISVLKDGEFGKVQRGEFTVTGNRPDGSIIVDTIDTTNVLAVPSSQWRVSSHDATQYGSRLLADLIPGRKFPFPKSLYAVEDTLRFFVEDNPDALILDFFGGSGTTAHAVARLNQRDGGRRRSVTVTNNEVSVDEAEVLRQQGLRPGDEGWEALGIFEHITKPRLEAAISGHNPDGQLLEGSYSFEPTTPMADGFRENMEFFRLDFLDPASVARGDAFKAILPILWMMAGCRGEREDSKGSGKWFIPKNSPFAVLIKEKEFRDFREELSHRPDIRLVFLVTDSEENFGTMRRGLGNDVEAMQLYKSYLENFALNTPLP